MPIEFIEYSCLAKKPFKIAEHQVNKKNTLISIIPKKVHF